ncbi:hypothetical protein DPMN_018494 [Dreissena polymorpha]|uniref:Uncharacterized protein n=1 Tax=Dreissena polymorpha TaxID=45954 RepID=A0A9D4NGR7_DREPO|nr:hypothetical protein DPMN_018494 [Dreissena polymorpha]
MASIAYCFPGLRFTLFENKILRSVTLTDESLHACSLLDEIVSVRATRPAQFVDAQHPIVDKRHRRWDGSLTHQGSAVGSVDVTNMGDDTYGRHARMTKDVFVLNFLNTL